MAHEEVMDYLEKYLFFYGGRGGGKSKTAALDIAERGWTIAGLQTLVTRKTLPSLRITAMKDTLDAIEKLKIPGHFKKSEYTYYYDNGSMIYFFPLFEQARRSTRLKSLDLNVIWAEEATEMTKLDFDEIKWTMRLPGFRQMIFTFNPPENGNHWLYKEYERQKAKGRARKIHFDIEDNPLLPEDEKQELRDLKGIDKGLYLRYAIGKWGIDVIRNRVWTNIHLGVLEDKKPTFGGIDHGYSHPAAVHLFREKNDELNVMDEIYVRRHQPEELGELIAQMLKDWNLKKSEFPFHADSEDPAANDMLESMGFYIIPATKGPGSVNEGIEAVRRLKVIVDEEKCPNAWRELPAWIYKKDKDGKSTEKPVEFNDHCCATIRYAVLGERDEELQLSVVGG